MASPSCPIPDADILELTGETSLADVKDLNLRNRKLQSFDALCEKLPSIEALSLSHNQLMNLPKLSTLPNLVTLNVNFNSLQSCSGLENCVSLKHLHLANNKIRDISALSSCCSLQVLGLLRNSISSLDACLSVLNCLQYLKELELSGNPCSIVPEYKPRLIVELSLETLDGDRLTQLDYEMANDFFNQQSENGTAAPPAPGSADQTHAASTSNSAHARPGTPDHAPLGLPPPPPSIKFQAPALNIPRPVTPNFSGPPPSPYHPSRSQLSSPGGTRPGTAGPRPNTAPAGSANVQLYSNDFLNDHPILLEYLAQHVVAQGLSLAAPQPDSPSAAAGNGGGSGSGSNTPAAGGGSHRLKSSFVARLRDTAAAMSACQDMDVATMASNPLFASRAAAVEQLILASSPQDTLRQLVKLCEMLIQEVQAARNQMPGPLTRPGTAKGPRPGTATGRRPATPAGPSGGGSSCMSGDDEVARLRSEVEMLQRQVKVLENENSNMFWLAEENKRLKKEVEGLQGRQAS